MKTVYIGIDPGASGGIAIIYPDGGVVAFKMPATETDLLEELEGISLSNNLMVPCVAALEKVHAMPKQGVTSTFTFGMAYGGLRMALTACRIPFVDVTPQCWQKAMGCLTKGDKNVSKRMAQQLFPNIKITHAIADALLIAEWLRRTSK